MTEIDVWRRYLDRTECAEDFDVIDGGFKHEPHRGLEARARMAKLYAWVTLVDDGSWAPLTVEYPNATSPMPLIASTIAGARGYAEIARGHARRHKVGVRLVQLVEDGTIDRYTPEG